MGADATLVPSLVIVAFTRLSPQRTPPTDASHAFRRANRWEALGGDSVAAMELIAAWEHEERKLAGGRWPTPHASMATPLTVRDIFALSPVQLRRKAQARLGYGCVGVSHAAAFTPGPGDEDKASVRTEDTTRAACAPHAREGFLVADECEHASGERRPTLFWVQEAMGVSADGGGGGTATAPEPTEKPAAHDTATVLASSYVNSAGPCVLVTGATGFLGPHLLAALLDTTHPAAWATIVILARPPTERVQLPDVAPFRGQRILVLAADFSQPHLGLSARDQAILASLQVQAIVHR